MLLDGRCSCQRPPPRAGRAGADETVRAVPAHVAVLKGTCRRGAMTGAGLASLAATRLTRRRAQAAGRSGSRCCHAGGSGTQPSAGLTPWRRLVRRPYEAAWTCRTHMIHLGIGALLPGRCSTQSRSHSVRRGHKHARERARQLMHWVAVTASIRQMAQPMAVSRGNMNTNGRRRSCCIAVTA